jgi:Bifunctional DNA primase/polymerase, N-terminal
MGTTQDLAPTDLLTAALAAADRGWPVFPLVPGSKRPALHGTDHCPRTGACAANHRGWEQRATTDAARIRSAWATGAWNVGLATGRAGLVVVDLDTAKPGDRRPATWAQPGVACGADVLMCLACDAGQVPPFDTFTVATPSGGTHLYFRAPEGAELRNTAGTLGWKIDTRAHGGYVVGPGSLVLGRAYEVVDDQPPAPLPVWLAERLTPVPLPPQRPVRVSLGSDRYSAYLRSAVRAEVDRVTGSPPDGHNVALYRAAVALGQLVAGTALGEAEVTAWLADAAAQVGQRPGETARTIRSGLRAGAQRPRSVAA